MGPENPAHLVLGLVAVLVAAVFGGMSYSYIASLADAPAATRAPHNAVAPPDEGIAPISANDR